MGCDMSYKIFNAYQSAGFSFNNSTTGPNAIANSAVAPVCLGERPVILVCQPYTSSGSLYVTNNSSGSVSSNIYIYRDGSSIAKFYFGIAATAESSLLEVQYQPSAIFFTDFPSIGSHTYELYVGTTFGSIIATGSLQLMALVF